jgi:hypothetical protein
LSLSKAAVIAFPAAVRAFRVEAPRSPLKCSNNTRVMVDTADLCVAS